MIASAGRPSALAPEELDRRLLVIGDSIMLGAHDDLVARLGATGWQVTPVLAESLHTYDAPALVDTHRDALGDVVVVGLGTNDGQTPQQLGGWIDDLMHRLQGVKRVYWVNLPPFADWVPAANAEIVAAQERWRRLRVIDWNARAAGDAALRYADGIHLTLAGRVAMAELVGVTLDGDAAAPVTTAAPATTTPPTTVPVTTEPERALTIRPNEGGGRENTLAVVALVAAGALGAGLVAIGWARRPRVPSARASRLADRPGVGLDRPRVRQRPRHRR